MSAELDDADDDALVYLAHVLPCLATCGITVVAIGVKNQWSASLQTWQKVDDVIMRLSQGTVSRVILLRYTYADAPPWKTLPYECVNEVSKQVLPKCTAAGLIELCNGKSEWCRLHDQRR